ncbi:QWRF family [Parasponia andersonii]|uniref:QWRF family n=1 Tax=Parasponia andersonii TaxID=3476 RepID=A0A2P5BQE4_PARAD|nr:QWRF family [Parasponia andersonii]
MEISYSRRQPPPTPPSPSPRLIRSRSGGSSITNLPPTTSPGGKLSSTSQRYSNANRSKSTTRTRPNHHKSSTTKEEEHHHKSTTNSHVVQKKPQDRDQSGFTRFLQRGTLRGFGATKAAAAATAGPKSVSGSPSAWALSPARSLPFASPVAAAAAAAPDSSPGSGRVKTKSGGGVNGVLKYFRQKKSKLFTVWLRIFKMRNSIMEKRIELLKLKHEIKLYQILNPQILLLNEWSKLERRNQESVGKLVAKLSGISVKLPLIHGAKADVMSIYESIFTAVDAMEGIEPIITKYFTEVERILYMVTELLITKKQHKDNFEELEKIITYVYTLVAKETSLRAHYIEAALESVRCQNN